MLLARRDAVRAVDEQGEAEGGDDRSEDHDLRDKLTGAEETHLLGGRR